MIRILILMNMCISIVTYAQIKNTKKETFSVKGNCEQCKTRIETATLQTNISKGTWNIETQNLTIEYDSLQSSSSKILKKIAEVGHDNEKYKAKDMVYNTLPACCLYDRTQNKEIKIESTIQKSDSLSKEINHFEHNHTKDSLESKKGNLNEVSVKGKIESIQLLNNAPLGYNINKKELLKAACCNLSESFETNATVDVSYSNAVTGTKQLKILGLNQKYTLLTKEFMPDIRGLASALGLDFIPGRWIESIQLTKGGGTVVNGYEAITGQINAEMIKFNKKDKTTFNLFTNNNSRVEFNATQTKKINEAFSNSTMLHASGILSKIDNNSDGFLDNPLSKQLNFMNILKYHSEIGIESMLGLSALYDKRQGGQVKFQENRDPLTQNYYGTHIETTRIQIWNKTGYIFKDKPYQSMGLQTQFIYHQNDSYFGQRTYNGIEKSLYANYIFESILGNTNNKYKIGASFLYDDYKEEYNQNQYIKTEKVPGVFAEYTYSQLEKLIIVAGLRTDFHNTAGTQFTPRINIKYDVFPKTSLRLSVGRGFRTANVFADNLQYFASQRKLEINLNPISSTFNLDPEIAWNYGVSVAQEFKIFKRKSTIVADFFNTNFQNQIVVDLENARKIQLYNLQGSSFANSLQIQWDFIPLKRVEARLAYKYYIVKTKYISGEKEVPFTAKHRAFLNLNYATVEKNNSHWDFDFTLQYIGKQRIPDTQINSMFNQLSNYSNDYIIMNTQIARNFSNKFRAYVGAENIGNYTQNKAILSAENPFGNEFDASLLYAPIRGTDFYIGINVTF